MRLKELRKREKLTQKKLAEVFGVSTQTILNWENDIFSPNTHQLIEIADFFGVSVDYLLNHETKKEFNRLDFLDLNEARKILKQIIDCLK